MHRVFAAWIEFLVPLIAFTIHAPPAEAQITSVRVASGLSVPTYVTAPDGDPERVFILEQAGLIKILKNGNLETQPFLDLTSDVNAANPEQGLLGLAFHPGFDANRYFYVYYVSGTGAGTSVVRRFTVSADPDLADETSGVSIFQIAQPTPSHNGGQIEFGPSGFLYLGLGDGGGSGDPQNFAQNPQSLLGKMLRIDVDADDFPADSVQNYAIPPTNPFVGNPGARDEIWALGFRNPYRFSLDALTDDLYVGDVGQFCYEEIDYQPASSSGGENYGWRLMEGSHCFDPAAQFNCDPPLKCNDGSLTLPIHDYFHTGGAGTCWAVIAGPVYRGSAIPGVQGHFFFGDYCTGKIWSFRVDGGVATDFTDWTDDLAPEPPHAINFPSAIASDGVGEIYIADWSPGSSGELYKIIPDPDAVGTPLRDETGLRRPLLTARPNPFRDSASLELSLERASEVEVGVYTAAGRLVRRVHRGVVIAGGTILEWDGTDRRGRPVPAGIYFVRAESAGWSSTSRLTRIR
jgi:glucose/arabinose dehydrogenase